MLMKIQLLTMFDLRCWILDLWCITPSKTLAGIEYQVSRIQDQEFFPAAAYPKYSIGALNYLYRSIALPNPGIEFLMVLSSTQNAMRK
jgi:hypothetical protein